VGRRISVTRSATSRARYGYGLPTGFVTGCRGNANIMKTPTRKGVVAVVSTATKTRTKHSSRRTAFLYGAGSVFGIFGDLKSKTTEQALAGDASVVRRSFGRQFSKAAAVAAAAKRRVG